MLSAPGLVGAVCARKGQTGQREREGGRTISGDKDQAVLAQTRHLDVDAVDAVANALCPGDEIRLAIYPLRAGGGLCDNKVCKIDMSSLRFTTLGLTTHSLLAQRGGTRRARGRGCWSG